MPNFPNFGDFNSNLGFANAESVVEIELDKLREFMDHPFKVCDNEDMEALIDSVKTNGKILEPIIVRTSEKDIGFYEIISGHRRCHAAKECGFDKIPAIVKSLTDDEATIMMVDANLRREHLSFSEKAYAYRMKYDSLKHQGKAGNGNSLEKLSENSSDSEKKIYRLIRLTYLLPAFLQMVDDNKLPFLSGVDLSYLDEKSQALVFSIVAEMPDMKLDAKTVSAIRLLYTSSDPHGKPEVFSKDAVRKIIFPDIQRKKKFTWKSDRIFDYFPADKENSEIEEAILMLLEKYKDEL